MAPEFMNRQELTEYYIEVILANGWHWFGYHFFQYAKGKEHPLAYSIIDACLDCENKMPGFSKLFSDRMASYRGKEKFIPHYEQLIQMLAELLVISHLCRKCVKGEIFTHEPTIQGSPKNPELLMEDGTQKIIVEVKCREFIQFHNARSDAGVQVAARAEGIRGIAEQIAGPEELIVYPRDNTVKDFLVSADEKFKPFKNNDQNVLSVLVIVWDDFIYEPISSLTNKYSGLLTENSFFETNSAPHIFANIDAIVLLRHSHQIVRATRDEPCCDGIQHAMDYGTEFTCFPKAVVPVNANQEQLDLIIDLFEGTHIEELQMVSDYRPQEVIMRI